APCRPWGHLTSASPYLHRTPRYGAMVPDPRRYLLLAVQWLPSIASSKWGAEQVNQQCTELALIALVEDNEPILLIILKGRVCCPIGDGGEVVAAKGPTVRREVNCVCAGIFSGGVGPDVDPAVIDRQVMIFTGKVIRVVLLRFYHCRACCSELLDK